VDELSLKTSQAMSVALYQSKGASDRLNEGNKKTQKKRQRAIYTDSSTLLAKHIKVLAKETRHYATSIFESMHRIQHLLDPEDCIGHPDFEKRWPVLNSLHQRASTERPPAFLPSSSSSSSTLANDERAQRRQKSLTASTTVSLANVALVSETASLSPSSASSASAPSAPNDHYPSSTMDRLQRLINEATPHDQSQDNVYPEAPTVE
jgi:tRNA C32,U32 (ribose-2'-O)-methylase TrmJ